MGTYEIHPLVDVEPLKLAPDVDGAGNHIVRTAVDYDLCTLTQRLAIQYKMSDTMFESRKVRTSDMIESIANDAADKIREAVIKQLVNLNARNINGA